MVRIVRIAIDSSYLYLAENEILHKLQDVPADAFPTEGRDSTYTDFARGEYKPEDRTKRSWGISPPMATTDPLYKHITDLLKNVEEDRWEEVDVTSKYRFFTTDASPRYDYGYCVPVAPMGTARLFPGERFEKAARVVAIPPRNADYQRGRYSSGLHVSEEITAEALAAICP